MTTGLLRRPDAAFKAMGDDTARHQVNRAQVERGQQAREAFEENIQLAPAIRAIDRSVEFLDLVTACHAFVAASARVVPGLRDRQLGDDERVIIHENVARVRATFSELRAAASMHCRGVAASLVHVAICPKVGMPRCTTVDLRRSSASSWLSFSSAPARLTRSPSTSPSHPSCSASATRAMSHQST